MGIDEKELGEAIGRLAEGNAAEATALLANVLVTAATAPLLGPLSVAAGQAAKGVAKALAARISNSAVDRMVEAGRELDESRAASLLLQRTIQESLKEAALEQC